MEDYLELIVNKPWGFEYLMYQNDSVGLWYLHIRPGSRTSMHCHPRKKTGLVLLSGEAMVSFLNGSVSLSAPGKLIIRAGLFHTTAAISPDGIVVLEIENPRDKKDLVRLEDDYGRQEKPYEGVEAVSPLTEQYVRLNVPEKGKRNEYILHGCLLSIERIEDEISLAHPLSDEIVVVLEGGLFTQEGQPVLSAGDVISPGTLDRLAQRFSAPHGISLLTIHKLENGSKS